MHVAKYWRNKKLRYRMIRMTDHGNEKRAAAEVRPGRVPHNLETHKTRVKAVS